MMSSFSKQRRSGAAIVLLIALGLGLSACGQSTVEGATDGQTPSSARTPSPTRPVTVGQGAATTPAGGTGARGTVGIGSGGTNATVGADGTRIEGTAGAGNRAPDVGGSTQNTNTGSSGNAVNAAGGAGANQNQTGGNATGQGNTGGTSTGGGGGVNAGGIPTQTPANAQAGAAGQAGTGAGALQPTPTAGSGNLKNLTPGARDASGLLIYPGAEKVTIKEDKLGHVIQGYDNLKSSLTGGSLTIYRLAGSGEAKEKEGVTPLGYRVTEFYRSELQSQGWTERTNLLTFVKEFSGLAFFGAPPSLFMKGEQALLVAGSLPITAETIEHAGLQNEFKAGDVAIMTMTGTPKVKLQ